ncbi:MAG TPA: DUF424 domain-containing protein [Methanospirillum sp.]|nr:DUF424 domain-containing protein [Methanospirillum sp.]
MHLKIHRPTGSQEVAGLCDRELVGTTLTEGALNVIISPSFFGDTPVSEEEVLAALRNCDNINIFGERCISLAVKNGIFERDSCREIAGVPYATIMRL